MNDPHTNQRGIARTSRGDRPCIIDHIVRSTKMLECRDLETNTIYTLHRTDFMPSSTILPQHRKSAFLLVAHHWAHALTLYPKPYLIDPKPLSVVTMSRKLRDARIAKEKYGYLYDGIDERLWKLYSDEISVTEKPEGVWLGSPESKREETALKAPSGIEAGGTRIEWTHLDQLDHLFYMKAYKMFKPDQPFIVAGITAEQVTMFEQRYDVAIVEIEGRENEWRVL